MKALHVLDHYGLLQGARIGFESVVVVCPFHGDTKPSMTVNLDGRHFCFGCDATGHYLVDLIQRLEGCTSWKALTRYSQITKGVVDDEMLVSVGRMDEAEATKEAFDFFYTLPKPSWSVIQRHYMFTRGFKRSTLRQYDVRINQSSTYPVIIPIYEDAAFRGYVTRRVDEGEPKYLFNEGFPKRGTLGGRLRRADTLVVEGILDLMRATQNGFTNTVCLFGWKSSEYQLAKLETKAKSIISGLDNDEAGRRGHRQLKKHFRGKMPLYRFAYPVGVKDIGSMRKGAFDRALENTVG